jgi:hypothetical protein
MVFKKWKNVKKPMGLWPVLLRNLSVHQGVGNNQNQEFIKKINSKEPPQHWFLIPLKFDSISTTFYACNNSTADSLF